MAFREQYLEQAGTVQQPIEILIITVSLRINIVVECFWSSNSGTGYWVDNLDYSVARHHSCCVQGENFQEDSEPENRYESLNSLTIILYIN